MAISVVVFLRSYICVVAQQLQPALVILASHIGATVVAPAAPLWVQFPLNMPRKAAQGDSDALVSAKHMRERREFWVSWPQSGPALVTVALWWVNW